MPKVSNKERSMALYESILQLKDLDECCAFFDDLCTVGELRAMEQRYDVATLLDEGLVYTEILEKTGASSATISRVNRIFSFRGRRLPPHDRPPEGIRAAEDRGLKPSPQRKRRTQVLRDLRPFLLFSARLCPSSPCRRRGPPGWGRGPSPRRGAPAGPAA